MSRTCTAPTPNGNLALHLEDGLASRRSPKSIVGPIQGVWKSANPFGYVENAAKAFNELAQGEVFCALGLVSGAIAGGFIGAGALL